MFELDPEADANHSSRIGEIELVPKKLVDVFGAPPPGDGYKVSGRYQFSSSGEANVVFTLYDWRATSLFEDNIVVGDDSILLSPDDFWGNWNPETFHIGGSGKKLLGEFKTWLVTYVA